MDKLFDDLPAIVQDPLEFHHDSIDITIEKSYGDIDS